MKPITLNKKLLVLAVSAATLNLQSAGVLAQENDNATALEEINVIGYRGSLQDALKEKRSSANVIEAISSSDIAQLPDVSIADSLARLPGLFATEDRGNASLISARGLGARMTFATLNGRELATAEPNRAIRFEQFPSELISDAQVYKTPSANLLEGGVASTININTANPLDLDERRFTLRGEMLKYAQGSQRPGDDGEGFRGSVSYTDQFFDNTLGVFVGISQQDQPATLLLTDRWANNSSASDFNADGEDDFLPWGGQVLSLGGTNERSSVTGKVQWKPNDTTELSWDVYQAGYKIEEEEDNFWGCTWPWGPGSIDPSTATVDGSNYVTSASGTLSAGESCLTVAPARWSREDELFATGLNGKWQLGNGWDMEADLSYSLAEKNNVWRSSFLGYSGPDVPFSADFTGGPVTIDYGDATDDLNNYFVPDLTAANDGNLEDEIKAFRLDFGHDLDGAFSRLDFGMRYSDREKFSKSRGYTQPLIVSQAEAVDYVVNAATPYNIGGNTLFNFDVDALIDNLYGGLDRANRPIEKGRSWNVTEETVSAYAMLSFDTELAGLPLSGNLGSRLIQTETLSTGHVNDAAHPDADADGFAPYSDGTEYTKLLPSLNATLELSEDKLLRFGMARVLSRPPINDLRSSLNVDRTSATPTASGGNPKLLPFVADQLDLSYEWYFNDRSLLALALFYKDVKSNIGIEVTPLEANPAILGPTGSYMAPINGEGGRISGVEINYQTEFGFIEGLGFNGNIALIDSNIVDVTVVDQPLVGLSDLVYAAELWYAKDKIETRLSYSYQDDYTSQTSFASNSLSRFEGAGDLDFSFIYRVTDDFSVRLHGSNLTEAGTSTYGSNNPDDQVRTRDWGRRYSLGFNYLF